MADTSFQLRNPNGDIVQVKLVDNYDGTYSLGLPATTLSVVGTGSAQTEDNYVTVKAADGGAVLPGFPMMVATGKLYNLATEQQLTPKWAPLAAATAGDNTLLAAVASKKIRVLALVLVAGAAGNVYFTSGVGGTVIFGGATNKINLAANGTLALPFNPLGWFENAAVNQALVLNASSTGPFSGGLVYVEV